jgi:hypothetical protein
MAGHDKLHVVPISWKQACMFIKLNHRHHKPPRGQKFAIGVVDETGTLHGVATCGRPVSRMLDNGLTLEVNRTCTDQYPNVNSMLYGACARIAAAMGYNDIYTDTQEGESGASLRAAGWKNEGTRKPRKNWAESSVKLHHLRSMDSPGMVARTRWSKAVNGGSR